MIVSPWMGLTAGSNRSSICIAIPIRRTGERVALGWLVNGLTFVVGRVNSTSADLRPRGGETRAPSSLIPSGVVASRSASVQKEGRTRTIHSILLSLFFSLLFLSFFSPFPAGAPARADCRDIQIVEERPLCLPLRTLTAKRAASSYIAIHPAGEFSPRGMRESRRSYGAGGGFRSKNGRVGQARRVFVGSRRYSLWRRKEIQLTRDFGVLHVLVQWI